ncbi:hypothetical protein [Flavobacterium branchiophilum]|uniref:Uncharacterized protein n=1 Tax=Flavobacterium branchiophilum TaxID=55197 RepID=A0A2H3KC44_9FLAO|nr:hypothetical protein [Flavobacterium branchiophilum]PDS24825.1 hypothetical protein B0A77_06780 [Flavobacterium branchiophilum]
MRYIKIHKLFVIVFILLINFVNAQTVTGVASNLGCKNSGKLTASSTGLGTGPVYQLQKSDGTVLAPIAGDVNQFTSSNVFSGLATGSYIIKGKSTSNTTVFSSATIAVSDGYTNMSLTNPSLSLPCVGESKVVAVTLSGGKSPFVYSIKNNATNTVLETSASTTATTFSFAALPIGSYTVTVEDGCGQTIISPTTISNPSVTVSSVKTKATNYFQKDASSCSSPIKLFIQSGFGNTNGSNLSAAEAALFTWKIKYNGAYYGKDIDGDGYSDLNSPGYSLSSTFVNMPIGVSRQNIITNISSIKVVILDACGNSKEVSTTYLNGIISATTDCVNGSRVRPVVNPALVCFPITYTFTNTTNAADVLQFTQTTDGQYFTGFTAGKTYSFTYNDANGTTSNMFSVTSVALPANSTTLVVNQATSFVSSNYLEYGTLRLVFSGVASNSVINYTVTASNSPLVPVGTTGSTLSDADVPSVNITDPSGYWPKGTYTLSFTSSCGNGSKTVTVNGRTASISSFSTVNVCGGFDYKMIGNFDDSAAYEVVIVSGPSNVGLTKDLASTTESLLFEGLTNGNYVFGLRIKGGTRNVYTQTVNFDATSIIAIDKATTGGYTCADGETNAILTINATSSSPAPNNVLEYRIANGFGGTFGPFQSSNTFEGLTNSLYSYQIKDGCGNVVTDIVQIGSASSPVASSDITNFCGASYNQVNLFIDLNNAVYDWTGPGINATNKTQRNPAINVTDMSNGDNQYSVHVTTQAPCFIDKTVSVTVTKIAETKLPISGTPKAYLVAVSTQNQTANAITNSKNGALVLESKTKGFVITRQTTTQINALNPSEGMLVFDTDENCLKLYNGTTWNCIKQVCVP